MLKYQWHPNCPPSICVIDVPHYAKAGPESQMWFFFLPWMIAPQANEHNGRHCTDCTSDRSTASTECLLPWLLFPFKLLQVLTEHPLNELQMFYKSDTERSTNSVQQLLRNFQNTICHLVERACEAQAECEEFCSVNASFSARDAFDPIRRMYTDPQASSQGRRWPWNC